MTEGNTALNALVGGAVSIVLSIVLFSPLIGGGVAGYLQKGSVEDGAVVGFWAGLIALIPGLLVVGLIGLFVAVPAGPGLFHWRLALGFVMLIIAIYAVGLSVLGGVVGAYLAIEREANGAGESEDGL